MRTLRNLRNTAFTLIELLIVVAIIAILAAIAVPNFLEAQTRAKISRAKADHRTIATGLETYNIDHNQYMRNNLMSWAMTFGSTDPFMAATLERLTTPISYLTSGAGFTDPFVGVNQYHGGNLGQITPIADESARYGIPADANPEKLYRYIARGPKDTTIWGQINDTQKAVWYLLESCGPDKHYHRMGDALNPAENANRRIQLSKAIYDASNGTVSRGSIWRGGGGVGKGSFFKDMVSQAN